MLLPVAWLTYQRALCTKTLPRGSVAYQRAPCTKRDAAKPVLYPSDQTRYKFVGSPAIGVLATASRLSGILTCNSSHPFQKILNRIILRPTECCKRKTMSGTRLSTRPCMGSLPCPEEGYFHYFKSERTPRRLHEMNISSTGTIKWGWRRLKAREISAGPSMLR